jgi:hypothetical protein
MQDADGYAASAERDEGARVTNYCLCSFDACGRYKPVPAARSMPRTRRPLRGPRLRVRAAGCVVNNFFSCCVLVVFGVECVLGCASVTKIL